MSETAPGGIMCRLSPGQKEVVCGRFPSSVSLDCLCSTTKGSLPGIPQYQASRCTVLVSYHPR
eukprot:scaffold24502_cov93-Phaeocystis_antarctica.AAC.1